MAKKKLAMQHSGTFNDKATKLAKLKADRMKLKKDAWAKKSMQTNAKLQKKK